MALKLGIQTHQILTNNVEVSIPSLSSILLAVENSTDYYSRKGQLGNICAIFKEFLKKKFQIFFFSCQISFRIPRSQLTALANVEIRTGQ